MHECRFGPAPVCKYLFEFRRLFSAKLETVVKMTKTGAALSVGAVGVGCLGYRYTLWLKALAVRENNDTLVARKFLKELT